VVLTRPLATADAPRYRRLMLHAYEHASDAFTSTAQERAALPDAWWEKRIADPQGLSLAFGAFADDGTLAGTVALEFSAKPKTKHKALLIGMYVLEACRGKGLGKALLQAAVAHTERRAGVLVITLTVTDGNESAIALYTAAGFGVFGTEPMALHTPTGYRAKVHMWRRVGEHTP
jgi:ribosomal protein S18 acetylase RimI-like enzyme